MSNRYQLVYARKTVFLNPESEQSTPKRIKVSLKARKKSNNKVRVQMDSMLNQIYQRMSENSTSIQDSQDIQGLDNQLVHQYVKTVYDEYDIDDPVTTQRMKKQRYKTEGLKQQFSTPIKKEYEFFNSEEKKTRTRSKTLKKIKQMRNNFQKQWKQGPTSSFYLSENEIRNKSFSRPKINEKKKILLKGRRNKREKMLVNLSQNESQSPLYCLACEKQVKRTFNQHATICPLLNSLLCESNDSILETLISEKIEHLKGKLSREKQKLLDNLGKFEKSIDNSLNGIEVSINSGSITHDSSSSFQKCKELLQKINSFQRLKRQNKILDKKQNIS